MADKKLSSVSSVSDAAYVYAETSNGDTVKISKADLASVVAGLIPKTTIHSLLSLNYTTTSGDLNKAEFGAIIFCDTGSKNSPSPTMRGYAIALGSGAYYMQLYLDLDTIVLYIRRYAFSAWSNWIALN